MKIYIEKLTVWSFFGEAIWRLLKMGRTNQQKLHLSYIDGTPIAVSWTHWLCKLLCWKFSRLSFELMDIREEGSGDLIRLCIPWDYLWTLKKDLENTYPEVFQRSYEEPMLGMFLKKSALCPSILFPGSLSRAIYLLHVVHQDMKQRGNQESMFLLLKFPWSKVLKSYAARLGIQVIYLNHLYPIQQPLVVGNTFTQWMKAYAKEILTVYFPRALEWLKSGVHKSAYGKINAIAKVAVFGRGWTHFENDGYNSDIFYSLQSSLPRQSLMLIQYRVSEQLLQLLSQYQIPACQMSSMSNSTLMAYYLGPRRLSPFSSIKYLNLSFQEKRWSQYKQADYYYQKSYWREFFEKHYVKIFSTWFKYDAEHIPITQAIRETGGIMTIWQLAYEELPNIETSVYTDISFGYSPWLAETEKAQESQIKYYVSTGFLQDHSHVLLKPRSLELRKQFHHQGCKKIVSVFDENSDQDHRWHTGHILQRKHYQFWAEKILEKPELGVIFKPKVPQTLRKRLGDVAKLLEEAEKTGRCLVLERSGEHSSAIPPIMAAMASDVAIQGHMAAGTTAMECALAGVLSLAVDYEGWRRSRLYQLEGTVVFQNYESLWDALQEHWSSTTGGIPGFGDWSPFLDSLDPFRDGRAAERMGNYLHWLIQGFEQGLDRDTIMADAATRYTKQWGENKVLSIN